jgi:hypothetical protein
LLWEPIPTMRWTVVDSPGASAKIAAPAMNAMTMIVGLFAMILFWCEADANAAPSS